MPNSEADTQITRPLFSRKPRAQEELIRDTALLFQVGQLTGAAAIVANWLATRQDEDCQEMGKKLAEVLGWFYEEKGRK